MILPTATWRTCPATAPSGLRYRRGLAGFYERFTIVNIHLGKKTKISAKITIELSDSFHSSDETAQVCRAICIHRGRRRRNGRERENRGTPQAQKSLGLLRQTHRLQRHPHPMRHANVHELHEGWSLAHRLPQISIPNLLAYIPLCKILPFFSFTTITATSLKRR